MSTVAEEEEAQNESTSTCKETWGAYAQEEMRIYYSPDSSYRTINAPCYSAIPIQGYDVQKRLVKVHNNGTQCLAWLLLWLNESTSADLLSSASYLCWPDSCCIVGLFNVTLVVMGTFLSLKEQTGESRKGHPSALHPGIEHSSLGKSLPASPSISVLKTAFSIKLTQLKHTTKLLKKKKINLSKSACAYLWNLTVC